MIVEILPRFDADSNVLSLASVGIIDQSSSAAVEDRSRTRPPSSSSLC